MTTTLYHSLSKCTAFHRKKAIKTLTLSLQFYFEIKFNFEVMKIIYTYWTISNRFDIINWIYLTIVVVIAGKYFILIGKTWPKVLTVI